MPFDPTQKVVWGTDASNVEMWSRGVLCAYIRGKLNDPQGEYYAALNLSPTRLAVITDNRQIASSKYSAQVSPPVVWALQEPSDPATWRSTIDGVTYDGARTDITLTLDMGIKDAQPADDNPVNEARDDSLLAGFVNTIIRTGFDELTALGLFNSDIKAGSQHPRAGEMRYPHTVKFFTRSLDTWTPNP